MKKDITLMHGDCLERMKEIESGSVDMILCDLPYGTTCCSWDAVIPFEPLWAEYKRVIKENGAIVLFSAQPFTAMLIASNLKMYRYEWIYEKPSAKGFMNANIQPLRAHENIEVFYKRKPTYNPIKTKGHNRQRAKRRDIGCEAYGKTLKLNEYDSTERFPRSVQVFSADTQNSSLHPTQKPVALCEYLIRTYTHAGETVLDNCMGSGSTGVACINTDRGFIGIEKEQKYFDIAQQRIMEALTGTDKQANLLQVAV
ncbi:DNA-methyltransferase [Acinetobacter radioresistens]|uniref:DNA-methyltransferase n=1 Tax=Acinetobacter radioresistens TaxID=40216 RepID=UPI002005FAE4|nr:site-specific DNA-methyltransferase [Acinetobacter radioresistens]MCK4106262.1 site-specific DNA-methyltransferase [Acinetobacter radioresistens]MCX0343092.1 site-specific DNA-methyltransferase [Acinetobacter radioresistens]